METLDSIPPNGVADLRVAAVTDSCIRVAWTAPGDDHDQGQAWEYDLRYRAGGLSDDTWANAVKVLPLDRPLVAGSVDSRWIADLRPATTYFVALVTGDEVENWSTLSNVIAVQTLDEFPDYYKPPTTPESLVWNLEAAHNRREFEPYLELLAPEFIFRFQPGDPLPGLGRDFWTLSDDSAGTYSLLTTGAVSFIEIDLTYGPAEPATEPELAGAMKIHVEPTYLAIRDTGGENRIVNGDIQHLFFRRGMGEDSDRWYMVEWRDIPAGEPGTSRSGLKSPTVVPSTWGRLKQHYGPH